MAKVIRFFHIRTGKKGGATVRVAGDTESIGTVDVQFSLCSKKDNFVKAIGRSCAEKAPVKVVPLRFLPRELGVISDKAKRAFNDDFTFAIKYFLPRE